jgi:excisionase family DNA binding protein
MSELQLLNTAEAAQLLGFHRKTVERMLRHGELPGFKIGHTWKLPLEQLRDWIQLHMNPTTTTHAEP